jgi:RNA-directed DNA polymerase
MTTGAKQSKNKKLLRHNEYYDIQEELDKLYAGSKENKKFNKLLDLILDERNIKLAYRNIKSNKGSNTPGVNGKTIKAISKWDEARLVKYVTNRLNNFNPMKIK